MSSGRGLHGDVAVVVESGGRQQVAVLASEGKNWRVVSRIPVNRGIRAVTWSPNGHQLAVTTAGGNLSNELRLIELDRRAQRVLANAKRADLAGFFGSLAWSPHGQWIAVTRSISLYGANIDLLDASDGSLSRSFRVSARHDSALAWSSNGTSLYFAEQATSRVRPRLRRLIIATGQVFPLTGARGLDPSIGPDGAVAFTADDGIWIIQRGRMRRLTETTRRDRFSIWLARGSLLTERPSPNCPRYARPQLCSHVVVLTQVRGTVRHVLAEAARNPAARSLDP